MLRASFLLALTLFAPAAAAMEVRGRVVGTDGKPAAKVPVELSTFAGETLGRATTDAQGAFRLEAAEVGMYRVVVRAPNAVPREARLLPLLETTELAPLRLEKSEPLRVRAQAGTRIAARAIRPHAREGWIDADRGGVTDEHGTLLVPRRAGETLEVATPKARARTAGTELTLRDEKPCARQLVIRDAGGAAVAKAHVLNESFHLGTTDEQGAATVTTACGRELVVETESGQRMRVPPAPASEITLAAPQPWSGRVVDAETREPLANAFVWSDDDPARYVRTDAKGVYAIALAPSRAAAAGHLASAAGPTFALQPTSAISGTVVDAEGKAVAGAELRIRDATADRNRPWPEGLPSRTTSGANGAFRIAALPQRAYTVEASHAGFAPSAVTVKDKRSGVEIVLAAGQSAFGKVTDESENPIAGAEVRLTAASDAPRFVRNEAEEEARVTFTDGEGNFRFEHLPRGTVDLEAKAESFAPATVRGVTIEAERAADLGTVMLERGVVLEGVVLDGDERPVAGAQVIAYPPSPAGIRGEAVARIAVAAGDAREAMSRGDGRFSITGLRAGEAIDVTARKAGYVAATLPQLELPHDEPLRMVLESGARVSGRVTGEQGEAVSGAIVTVRPSDSALPPGLSGQSTTTDGDGAFVLGELPPGRFAVSAAAKGYVSAEPRLLDVREGASLDDVALTLRRGSSIEGVVLTPTGAPAAGARVTVRGTVTPERMVDIELAGSARADGEGRYRIEGVSPGPQKIVADDERHARAVRELNVQPGTNRVDLRLGDGGTVGGRVVDGEGRPLAGASLALGGANRGEISDAQGVFRFTGVEPGNYTLTARKEGYAAARQELQLAGRPVEGLELRLVQGGGVITGRISGLPAALLAQLQVRAMEVPLTSMDGMRDGRTDAQGVYRIDGVHAGKWTVIARHGSGREARREVTIAEGAGQTQVDLEFGGGVALSGTVRRLGEPVSGASIQASGTRHASTGSALTDASGHFRITGLEPGEHVVVVTVAESGLRHSRQVAIDGEQQLDIDLPTARAAGIVLDAITRAPLAGVTIAAVAAGPTHPRATSNADGTFALTSLGRGSYRVTATSDGYEQAVVTVDVVADDATVEGLQLLLMPRR